MHATDYRRRHSSLADIIAALIACRHCRAALSFFSFSAFFVIFFSFVTAFLPGARGAFLLRRERDGFRHTAPPSADAAASYADFRLRHYGYATIISARFFDAAAIDIFAASALIAFFDYAADTSHYFQIRHADIVSFVDIFTLHYRLLSSGQTSAMPASAGDTIRRSFRHVESRPHISQMSRYFSSFSRHSLRLFFIDSRKISRFAFAAADIFFSR
jgi:hypothetical protein